VLNRARARKVGSVVWNVRPASFGPASRSGLGSVGHAGQNNPFEHEDEHEHEDDYEGRSIALRAQKTGEMLRCEQRDDKTCDFRILRRCFA
jgi:hypothetical protein